ncbi:hypothetical protein ACQP1G_44075 [Nocardia sp. CA-107356]|uniref:hypothetical protein n=1 Tax=Nocardia sp. CA-107356 TaxID=3239972 RepID=UPI003D8EEF89
MSDFELDPDKTRELAKTVRGHGDTVGGLAPLAEGLVALPTMESSDLAQTVDAVATGLNKVVEYHARRLHEFADLTDTAVTQFLAEDGAFADRLREAGQR